MTFEELGVKELRDSLVLKHAVHIDIDNGGRLPTTILATRMELHENGPFCQIRVAPTEEGLRLIDEFLSARAEIRRLETKLARAPEETQQGVVT